MSGTAVAGSRSPEARSGNELAATATKQIERAKRLAGIARSAGIQTAVKFAYSRITGTEIKEDIVLKPRELRFPITIKGNPSDIGNFNEIIGQRVYAMPASLSERIKGLPIVDMGAYVGISAAYFASRHPDSHVLAVEPHDRNFRMLSGNTASYGNQIDIRQAAFVPREGGVGRTILDAPDSHMANLYSSDGTENGDSRIATA
ncbi:MAG TPA: hypothetical protein VFW77_01525, partial [Candidatus Saccharimonadales bacterium]|nr:hypothetical protein [Candidatus Saccharimonadales bacterium]